MFYEGQERYAYRLDTSGHISFVSPAWLQFAADNEAPELTAERVIGKPIGEFIAGSETRALYELLYCHARSHQVEIAIPFRCDSPSIIRHMLLVLRPLHGGDLECEGVLLNSEAREPVNMLARWMDRSDQSIPICSICRRLQVRGEWVQVHEAIVRRRLFNAPPVPRLEETVCASCRLVFDDTR